MQIEELAKGLITAIQDIYAHNTDDDFDIQPLLALAKFNVEKPILMPLIGDINGDVLEIVVPKLIEASEPDVYGLVNASWLKDAETNERVGELVLLTLESKSEQVSYMFKVERNPLPVLGPPERGEAIAGRLTGFLYQPTRH